MIHGENKESEADEQDGRHSPPPFGDSEGAVAPLRTSNLGPESSCPNFEAMQPSAPALAPVASSSSSVAQPARVPRHRYNYVGDPDSEPAKGLSLRLGCVLLLGYAVALGRLEIFFKAFSNKVTCL